MTRDVLMSLHIFFWVVGLGLLANADKYCSYICKDKHTLCRRNPKKCHHPKDCGLEDFRLVSTKFTKDDEKYILKKHNEYRNKVAEGKVPEISNKTIANMNALLYDGELAYIAQCWANACQESNDICRITETYPDVGQNLANIYSKVDPINSSWDQWLHVAFPNSTVFNNEPNSAVQIVRGKARALGCGKLTYKSAVVVVCNYGTNINTSVETIFQFGPPCSACPKHLRCAMNYPNLCGDETYVPTDLRASKYLQSYAIVLVSVVVHSFA